ncbi:probable assembly chaperone of rpl4 [Actinia tenebrosa]|uniref:Probable assembly chaperone of rpl4 n=1 Tax=Actinia tenebrosa TaxID=6105 RepID=A0A6P8IE58_ACTTE|nr:probable assembly chaperone of rpl4 [Actinia tenebrosa]
MGKERKKKKKKPTKTNKVSQNTQEDKEQCCLDMQDGSAACSDNMKGSTGSQDINENGENKTYSVEDLLQKIEECMETFNYQLAQKFCERGLELDANHLLLLETAGAVFLETGEAEKAKKCFQHAIELCPDEGHAKYMYIGQILQGQEAVEAFTKGIELMISTMNSSSKGAAKSDTVSPNDVSTAYCSLAEIYMTDECFDTEAENKCFECCQKAVEYDPSNPDAYQTMANCLMSQEKIQDAQTMLKKGLDLWLGKDDDDTDQVPMPSYESRLTSAKLLLELEDFEVAGTVLQTLLEENDEDPQVWYLLGWMYHLSGQDNTSKKISLEKAKEISVKSGCEDEQFLQHIDELLSNMNPEKNGDVMDDEDDDDEAMET